MNTGYRTYHYLCQRLIDNLQSKRKRINRTAIVGELVVDVEAYVTNKSSLKARKITTASEHIEIEIYFDKHYFDRQQHGDDVGERVGIDSDTVQSLLIEAAKHLFYYSIRNKSFSFVNFEAVPRPERIVLTKEIDNEEPLNVVAEYHYLSLNKYEVTLKTAMKTNGFNLSDGQYQLVLHTDNTSSLIRFQNRNCTTVSEYKPQISRT